ncbi:MAG: helix-turn-helix domain-containing protein, partial [Plesiomonas sp.]
TISDWPGHIRQLRSFVDRLAVLADDTVITTEILSQFQKIPHGHAECSDVSALADALLRLPETNKLMAAEQLLLNRALQLCEGNKSAAARMLGVGRKVVERNLAVGEDQENALQRVLEEGHRFIMDAEYASAIKVLQQGLVRLHGLSAQENQLLHIQLLHFQLLRQLGSAYSALQGWSSSDALGCYEKALLVGKDLDCEDEKAAIQFGIWTTQLMSLELDKARNTAQQMLLCAGKTHASIDAHFVMANTLFWLGDHAEVLACLERGGLLTDLEQQQIGSQGFDIAGLVLTFEGLSAFQLGQFQRAHHALLSLVKRHHRNTDLPFSRAIALQGTVWLACLFEEDDLLATSSLELETLSKMHGFEFYHGVGMFFRGCHLSTHGDKAAAEAAMLEGYENYMLRHGGKLFHSFQAWKRIELLLNSERYLESDQLAAHALDMAIAHKERAYLGELLIVRARARWALGDLDAAEQGFYSALTTSEALGVIPAQLNAGIYLAQLLQQSGRSTHALGLLIKVLGSCDKRSCGNQQSDDWHPVVERAHHLLAQLQQVGSSVTSL